MARSEAASHGLMWSGHLTGLLDHVRDDATHEVRLGLPQHSHQVGELLLQGTNITTKTTQQHVHMNIGESQRLTGCSGGCRANTQLKESRVWEGCGGVTSPYASLRVR